MPARLKVRAVIWVGERVVVHRAQRRGHSHITLPGGRVNDRESVTAALRREVREELGLEIEIGDLLFAAEVLSGARRQDVELVFEAQLSGPVDERQLDLVDPQEASVRVLPPLLSEIAEERRDGVPKRWLGNIYTGARPPEAHRLG
jgi:ADP-ribose pyrophosphatase YjhB (NUDIX family)